jgi:hypothetical protein
MPGPGTLLSITESSGRSGMDGGLWHQTGGSRRSRVSATKKVGAVLGAGLPLGMAAATLLGRRKRRAEQKDGGTAPSA